MSFPHEAIAAWPTPGTGNPDRQLIRAMTTRRFAYCLAAGELASNFVAKDPVSGVPPLNLIKGGTLFAYDETDTTTAPSDVCLVTYDNCRYKSGSVELPDSVLTYSTTAQPADVDVSDGDRFLLPTGATGADWAGKAGQIAIRKGARWYFAISPIGRKLYVEDEDAFYYRNDSSVWTAGNGSITLAANSVKITNVLGAKASFVVKVENQTTNTPPASPVAPVNYVIGPSPTGAWAGLAGKVAMCLTDGTYTIITPTAGDEVYDKSRGIVVRFNGTAWVSASGAWTRSITRFVQSAAGASPTGTPYSYSNSIAPTSSQAGYYDGGNSIPLQALATGNKLRMYFEAFVQFTGSGSDPTVAIFRDSETTAWDWSYGFNIAASGSVKLTATFNGLTSDTLSHTYFVRIMSSTQILSYGRARFTIEEGIQ